MYLAAEGFVAVFITVYSGNFGYPLQGLSGFFVGWFKVFAVATPVRRSVRNISSLSKWSLVCYADKQMA